MGRCEGGKGATATAGGRGCRVAVWARGMGVVAGSGFGSGDGDSQLPNSQLPNSQPPNSQLPNRNRPKCLACIFLWATNKQTNNHRAWVACAVPDLLPDPSGVPRLPLLAVCVCTTVYAFGVTLWGEWRRT